MKKFYILMVFLSSFALNFSADIVDFESFSKGKQFYEQGEFEDAQFEFEVLLRNFPNSLLIENKYAYYYIGMNYYKLKNYDKARYYLEQAIYLPKEYQNNTGYFKIKKKHFFEYERNYYLAKVYTALEEVEEGEKHFKFLIKDYYDSGLVSFEKKALIELAKTDPYYEIIYKVKFDLDLDILDSLKTEDLLMLGNYFTSKGSYNNASTLFAKLNSIEPSHSTTVKHLEALTRSKKYDDILDITKVLVTSTDKNTSPSEFSDYSYYRGNAYRRKGLIPEALYNYDFVVDGSFKNTVKYDAARLNFLSENYNKAISILKTLTSSSAHKLLLDTYLAAGMDDDFTTSAVEYIVKYPTSDTSSYYRYLLYKNSQNEDYLTWIQKYNFNTYYYEISKELIGSQFELESFPLEEKLSEYKELVSKLTDLSKLGDAEILKMNFDSLSFVQTDKTFEGVLTSMIYEEANFYHNAIKSSYSYKKYFSEYDNLIEFLYPRYYSYSVQQAAKEYDVETALIYSVIKQESLFSENVVSRAAAYGLMQLILPTAKDLKSDVTIEELMEPSININLGTKYLKQLLKKYNGDVPKAIAAYNGGMTNVDRWVKNNNGELDIEAIPFIETKDYTKKVLNNYYKYKMLYD